MKRLAFILLCLLLIGLSGCDTAGQAGGKSDNVGSVFGIKGYTIVPREDTIPELVMVADARFSMKIPKGWVIETTGEFETFGFRVYDPNQPTRTIFYYGKMNNWLKSYAAKEFWEWYTATGSAAASVYADAPVLSNANIEELYYAFDEFAAYARKHGIQHNFPKFTNFEVIETFNTPTAMAPYAIDESTLRLQMRDQNNFPIDAMVTGTLVNAMTTYANGIDTGFYYAYRVSGIMAPADDFLYHHDRLTESLASFQYKEEYIKQGVALIEWGTQKALEMSRTLNETSEIINSSWDYRNQVVDKTNAEFISYLRGNHYVLDSDTNTIYELSGSDLTKFEDNRDKYKQNLTIIDEKHPAFGQPISGIIKP
jgi:hypothetical protein